VTKASANKGGAMSHQEPTKATSHNKPQAPLNLSKEEAIERDQGMNAYWAETRSIKENAEQLETVAEKQKNKYECLVEWLLKESRGMVNEKKNAIERNLHELKQKIHAEYPEILRDINKNKDNNHIDPKANYKFRKEINERVFHDWIATLYKPLLETIESIKTEKPEVAIENSPCNAAKNDRGEEKIWKTTIQPWWAKKRIEQAEEAIKKGAVNDIGKLRLKVLERYSGDIKNFNSIQNSLKDHLQARYKYWSGLIKEKESEAGKIKTPSRLFYNDRSSVRQSKKEINQNIQEAKDQLEQKTEIAEKAINNLSLQPNEADINASVIMRLFREGTSEFDGLESTMQTLTIPLKAKIGKLLKKPKKEVKSSQTR
jgi:hypothetical protein